MNDEFKEKKSDGLGRIKRWIKSFFPGPTSSNEVAEMLRSAQSESVIDTGVLKMMEGALKVSHLQAREIMIPRSQMVSLEHNLTLNSILDIVIDSQHSRFPVFGESSDDVSGILLAKELLPLLLRGKKTFQLSSFLRPATIIPESKRLDVLLKEFREHRYHMAIVVDEYGGVSGLLTIEDVLEEIVGEIEDETDEQESDPIQLISANLFSVSAITDIEVFNEFFDVGLADDECDTIGGLVLQGFGRLPDIDEEITIGGFDFKVTNADRRKIIFLSVRQHLTNAK
ncbi:MAG: magnesium/cobalt efflux protein [Porticoccaceae bacterium]|nr:magnesium/cobalt efflux protein [Porticoccaceae bacterium]